MNTFWDQRFSDQEYVYGTEPNLFFKTQVEKLTRGKILFPAEGEGRNAVFAATLGWEVTAFDPSVEGKKKAEKLARAKEVSIHYLISDYEQIKLHENSFDCLVLIFAHMHPEKRHTYHQKLVSFLKPGGTLILEGFSKNQLKNKSGGPPNIEMLFSEEEMQSDFNSLSELKIIETEYIINEGPFHQGKASVIQLTGNK